MADEIELPDYARVPGTLENRKAFDDWLKGGGKGKGPPAPGTLRPGWQALAAADAASGVLNIKAPTPSPLTVGSRPAGCVFMDGQPIGHIILR